MTSAQSQIFEGTSKIGGTHQGARLLAAGTLISRLTGFLRIMILPAIFGASALGDMFQAVNALPLALFATFGGQAVTSLLVPVLTRSKALSLERATLLGQRALGIVACGLLAFAALGMVLHQPIAALLASGLEGTQGNPAGIAAVLLLIMLPQIALYGCIAVLVAIQHSGGRFLLPSIAPTIENVSVVLSVALIARAFDDLHLTEAADTRVLVVLGLASTLSLLLHLAVQAFGAIRVVHSVMPKRPRAEPELVGLRQQFRTSVAWTALIGPRSIALAIAAGAAGAGGIQAMQIAYIVQTLPMALVGYPVAAALLPEQSRHQPGSRYIATSYASARNFVVWLVVPLGMAMTFLSRDLGATLSLGRFADADGATLVAAAAAGFGAAAASEAVFEVARQATFAAGDLSGFTRSLWWRGVVSLAGITIAILWFDGPELLIALGLAVSIADVCALILINRPLQELAGENDVFVGTVVRALVAAGAGAVVATQVLGHLTELPAFARLFVGGLVLLTTYLAVAWLITGRGCRIFPSFVADERITQ